MSRMSFGSGPFCWRCSNVLEAAGGKGAGGQVGAYSSFPCPPLVEIPSITRTRGDGSHRSYRPFVSCKSWLTHRVDPLYQTQPSPGQAAFYSLIPLSPVSNNSTMRENPSRNLQFFPVSLSMEIRFYVYERHILPLLIDETAIFARVSARLSQNTRRHPLPQQYRIISYL